MEDAFISLSRLGPKRIKYPAPDTPSALPQPRGESKGSGRMVTSYNPDAHRSPLRLLGRRREVSVDQVLIRLLLHLGAGLQVGRADQ